MKGLKILLPISLLIIFSFTVESFSQELPYTEGTVWDVTFVRTKSNMGLNYLRDLNQNWKQVLDEAKKEGLILSYRIFSASPATKDDWDLMLMTEYKNMASLDGLDIKFFKVATKVFGSEEQMDKKDIERDKFRDILGSKTAREIFLK